MDRRLFLQLVLLGLAEASLHGCASLVRVSPAEKKSAAANTKKEKIIFCFASGKPGFSVLRLMDWDGHIYAEHTVPLHSPHSFCQDKLQPQVIYLFEAFGSFLKLDLESGMHQKLDHRTTRDLSSGHGIQSRSGEFLLCAQTNSAVSSLTIRSSKNLAAVAEAPPECNFAHQVSQMPGTAIAVCGNMRTADSKYGGGVTFYDYEKQQIVNRIDCEYPIIHVLPVSATETLAISHHSHQPVLSNANVIKSSKDSAENLVAVMAHDPFLPGGPVYSVNIDGTKKIMGEDSLKPSLKGGFGLASLDKSARFLSSHTNSNQVILWENGTAAKIIKVPNPTHVMLNHENSRFLVRSKGMVRVFAMETMTELAPMPFPKPVYSFYKYYD